MKRSHPGKRSICLALPVALSLLSGAACNGASSPSHAGSTTGGADAAVDSATPPFAQNSPYTYVAKVKNILIGLPPTDDEVGAVVGASDPTAALQALIRRWMALPDPNAAAATTYYAEKMLTFFELATQQTQVGAAAFSEQFYPGQVDINASTTNRLVENAIESFARTVVDQVVNGGQPLTQVATTTTFMMTTALMETYAFLDGWQVDDSGTVVDHFARANPKAVITVGSAAVALADSANPNGATFMQWSDPDVVAGGAYAAVKNQGTGCATDPITYPATGLALHYLLYGGIVGRTVNGAKCGQFGGTKDAPQIGNTAHGGANDFSDWRAVTIRQPTAGEATTTFYDLPTLRQSNSLVLNLPRVGFFTTPAFFANWQTNSSNTMRVTINQALIVALGAMVDGTDVTVPPTGDGGLPPGLDAEHAAPGTACFACHQQLDPTRSILSATYSWNYHTQDTSSVAAQKGAFVFQGVVASPQSVLDLGNILATHPLFAPAWVQRFCEYANSQACETNDPEFTRVVTAFQSGGYSWNDLVVDLLSSPLTTEGSPTQTGTDKGVTTAVSRRDHLCAALNFRLGFDDVCGLLPTTTPVSSTVAQIAAGLPSDGYGRGAVAPVLPNSPTLFYRSGTENICAALAPLVIDVTPAKQVARTTWSSTDPQGAVADFVQTLMGIVPSDPRSAQAQAILLSHYQSALQTQGATKTTALQSTFVAACLAPSSVSIGM